MNAPVDFQGYINNTIQEAMENLASAYLDEILIYNNSGDEYEEHVKRVLEHLVKAGLYLKPE